LAERFWRWCRRNPRLAGANIAAVNAMGKVLLINCDDFFPQKHWDTELLKVIPDLEADFVVRTHPGAKYQAWLDSQGPLISRLMTFQILSQARYRRFGYALYPEFTSMLADTDFTDAAEADDVVIEARRIVIEHRHPFVTGAEQDQVSQHENSAEAHALGKQVYLRRQAERAARLEPAGIVAGVQNCLSIACQIEARTGLICRVINLGGGFGASHTEDRELELEALGRELTPILRQFHDASAVKRKVVFELGRFLTADAGIYVTRVISSKESRGKNFFMVDGGLHHHLAAAGSFGAAFRANFLQRNLSRPDAPAVKCSIAGPSCNPTDLLGIDVELPKPEVGDLIATKVAE
jgi:hypothetical protein